LWTWVIFCGMCSVSQIPNQGKQLRSSLEE
jgi:hypothetical protein